VYSVIFAAFGFPIAPFILSVFIFYPFQAVLHRIYATVLNEYCGGLLLFFFLLSHLHVPLIL
jgi:hypothetical protein